MNLFPRRLVHAERPAATPMHPSTANRATREELEASSRAVIAADQAYAQEAIRSVRWERRGLLQRLVRPDA
jgi:hypothetical protein